jgi:hypothetical protein
LVRRSGRMMSQEVVYTGVVGYRNLRYSDSLRRSVGTVLVLIMLVLGSCTVKSVVCTCVIRSPSPTRCIRSIHPSSPFACIIDPCLLKNHLESSHQHVVSHHANEQQQHKKTNKKPCIINQSNTIKKHPEDKIKRTRKRRITQ